MQHLTHRAERVARAHRAWMGLNEALGEGRARASQYFPYICECAGDSCARVIRLTLREYQAVRSHPGQAVVVPGHEVPAVDTVVESHGSRYTVIERRVIRDGARCPAPPRGRAVTNPRHPLARGGPPTSPTRSPDQERRRGPQRTSATATEPASRRAFSLTPSMS